MATYNSSRSTYGYTLRLTVELASVNASANTSTMRYSLDLISANAGYSYSGADTWSVKIGSITRSGTKSFTIYGGQTINYTSGTVTVNNGANGASTSVVCSASVDHGYLGTYGPPDISTISNNTFSVPAISSGQSQTAPASIPSVQDGSKYFGTAFTLTIAKQGSSSVNANYTHRVVYRLETQTKGTMLTSSAGTSYSVTIPTSDMPTDRRSCHCNINVETYNGSKYIGANSVGFTIDVPSSAAPTLGTFSITEEDSKVLELKKNNANIGYIQGVSKLKLSCPATAKNDASIVSHKFYVGNNEITSPWTPDTTESVTITCTAIDSRGFSVSKSSSALTIKAYSKPSISKFTLARFSGSARSDSGTTLKADINCSITSPNQSGNTMSVSITYGTSSSTRSGIGSYSYSHGTGTVGQTGWVTLSGEASASTRYYAKMTVTDKLGGSVTAYDEIGSEFTLINFGAGGKSIAFGGTSSDSSSGAFECFLPITTNKKLTVSTGGMAVTGATTFSTTVSAGGKLTVTSGGAEITGTTSSSEGFKHGSYFSTDGMASYRIYCGNVTINSGITSATLGGGSIAQSTYFTAAVIRGLLGLASSASVTSANTMMFVQNASTGGGGLAWNAKWNNSNAESTSGQYVVFSNTGTNASSITAVRLNLLIVRYA